MKYIVLSFVLLFSGFRFNQEAETASVREVVCDAIVYMKIIKVLQVSFLQKSLLSENICLNFETKECLQSIYDESSVLKNEFGSWQTFQNYLDNKGMINTEGGLVGHTSLLDFKTDNPTADNQLKTLFNVINNQCFNLFFDEMTDDEREGSLICMSRLIDRAKQENSCPSFY